jgi:hypothetical protein
MAAASATGSDLCFLSYSRSDEEFALRLAKDLQSRGVEMWVDRFSIRPSEHWDRAIERAIRGCRNVIAVLSPRSVASENVADEISLAIDAGKPIIPVVIEPCDLPLRLTRRHLIDATGSYDLALQQCFDEIEGGEHAAISAVAPPRREVAHDSQQIDAIKDQLAGIVGPIAQILVERAAPRAESIAALYRLLALHITNDDARAHFLGLSPEHVELPVDATALPPGDIVPDGEPIRPGDVERIATALTSFLGPIAPIVARKEGEASRTVSDLLRRLAAKLHCESDRAAFLRQLEVQ